MRKILYIIDNKSDLNAFIAFTKKRKLKGDLHFHVCPITTDSDLVNDAARRLSEYGQVEILPFIGEFHKNAFSYKNRFIKFLSDFSSGKNKSLLSLRKYFMHPSGKFSLWWLSLVQEKGPLKSQAYNNLAKLITIIDFQCNYSIDEVYVDIENTALRNSILKNTGRRKKYKRNKPKRAAVLDLPTSLIKAIGFILPFVIRKCILCVVLGPSRAKRISRLKKSNFLHITYFPFAEAEALEKNKFRNIYFGPLQESIEKCRKNNISWIGILTNKTGLNLSNISLARKINSWGYCLFLQEELISFHEIMNVFLTLLQTSFKFLLKMPYISSNLMFEHRGQINVWDIFKKEWIYSFSGSYLVGNLFYYHIFVNAISKIENKATIIYPAELNAWENALNIAYGGRKKIKTVGIQHASVPFLFLNYFNAPADFADGNTGNAFPAPDYLACSGEIPMKLLTDGGWPKERIFNMGAVRYHHLSKFLHKEINWEERKEQVVVALSILEEETAEVLSMLWRAFHDEKTLTFVIKPHAASPTQDLVGTFGFIIGANGRFRLDTESPLEELLVSSRAVIVAGSAASLDGIACQCSVIIPRLSHKADTNPLSMVSEGLARYVENKNELIDAVRSIANSKKAPLAFDKCKAFINEYFTIHDDKDEYFLRFKRELSKTRNSQSEVKWL